MTGVQTCALPILKITGGKLQAGDDAVEARYVSFDELPKIVFPSHIKFIGIVKALYSNEND